MKSLAALAKYTGCYDKWQQIRESFQLKWSNSDPLQDFNSIFNNEKDLNHMYHIIILIHTSIHFTMYMRLYHYSKFGIAISISGDESISSQSNTFSIGITCAKGS
jgi:hypothetical protein